MSNAKEFTHKVQELVHAAHTECLKISDQDALAALKIKYLGRKGLLAQLMSQLGRLEAQERPQAGQAANRGKTEIAQLFAEQEKTLRAQEAEKEKASFDFSLPGRTPWQGTLHPITLVSNEICSAFNQLGFEVVTGPEIENDFYNFEALNIPKDHPARDMQDTLYITENILLRTHTSPLQIRTMLEKQPPLAAIAPGKVYRRDADLTHSPMFHQIEGFLVDRDVSMADLRGTLTYFVQNIFTPQTKVRFRPSFFPFTEPSAEVDISCVICDGTGWCNEQPCRVCKQTGWVEILGCGMIDPAVFQAVGYDPEQYTGFAFGLGVERVAMLKYGIDDLKLFFENSFHFLGQFKTVLA